ncbi:MAG: arylsulfatase [Porphyromonadaceae bacterium]|nr:arylsulfatase [Porphyromonadaceae bacterium]
MKKQLTLPMVLLGSMGMLQAQTAERPNVIFILADDLGYGDVGCYGQQIIQTPHIDALAREGVRFTDFYAGCSVSAPSRASLMTGLHTGRTKIRGNKEIQPEGQAPMADRTTLGTLFKSAGYRTGLFGKWGLGFPGSGAEPLDRGFDRFYGYNCQRVSHLYYPEHLWSDRTKVSLPENKDDARGVYAPELIQKNALDFIRKAGQQGKPFFAMMTYTLPHAELNLPHDEIYRQYEGKVTPRPWQSQYKGDYPSTPDAHASFAAMVGKLDHYVGELVAELKRLGLEDKTLIVFTSDNGPHTEGGANPEYFDSNGPLRGVKRDLYEGGIRVPMIVRWAGQVPAGSVSDTPGAFWDFLPTFAQLLGQKATQPTSGVSLLSTWRGRSKCHKERGLYWEFHEEGGKMALRRGQWKLIALDVDKGNPRYELYNLREDIGETTNLADRYPKKLRQMQREMSRMHTPSAEFPFGHERKVAR